MTLTDITFSTFMFYALSSASIILALMVVNTRHILRAAVYLMGVLITSAGLYLLLGAEFLAGVQILVYVGGIVVLLVFAVMLTTTLNTLDEKPSLSRKLIGGIASVLFLAGMIWAIKKQNFPVMGDLTTSATDITTIGTLLLDRGSKGYLLPFEIISVLLLATIIGGIVVARKTPAGKE